jgi:hypothetical protein
MTNKTKKKNNKVRNLTLTVCALTLGIPMVAAALPSTYAFIVPLAIVLPFFTLSYLESALFRAAEV